MIPINSGLSRRQDRNYLWGRVKGLWLALLLLLFSVSALSCTHAPEEGLEQPKANPLLKPFDSPFETVPYDSIEPEHFLPAIEYTIAEGEEKIKAIVENSDQPTFKNTIETLAKADRRLKQIDRIFYSLRYTTANEKLQEISYDISSLVNDYYNDMYFNEALFDRVSAVYENMDQMDLDQEQKILLERQYDSFVSRGAEVSEQQKERLREISNELSSLRIRYEDNVLADRNKWFLQVTDEKDLDGLSAGFLDYLAEEASSRDLEGWVLTLDSTTYVAVLRNADNRQLREEIYRANSRIGNNDNEYNNSEIIEEFVNLRLERANILGYESHIEYVLSDMMVEGLPEVKAFAEELKEAIYPGAIKDVAIMSDYAAEKGLEEPFERWDIGYYSNKYRQDHLDFFADEAEKYFEVKNVKAGIFNLAEELWGISFKLNEDIPVYHPDLYVYEVYDHDGSFLGLIYMDLYVRPEKSAGAWAMSIRKQHYLDGEKTSPHVVMVCDFPAPSETEPSLLSHYNLTTFLHEFGHVMHEIFSDVTYPQLAGTGVTHDFVEFPAFLMENWDTEEEFLKTFAHHYETGEAIPGNLLDSITARDELFGAYNLMWQVKYCLLDIALHGITEPLDKPIGEYEHEALEDSRMLGIDQENLFSTSFDHFFSLSYHGRYYSYLWAEMLSANAYEVFREEGIFDRATGELLRDNILSRGGAEPPMDLFERFQDAEPVLEPMLKSRGVDY